jgi:hypothetical protein
VDHAIDVGSYPSLIAKVELLERMIVPCADRGDERGVLVAVDSRASCREGCGGLRGYGPLLLG